jgi:hypothetical protein
MTKLSRELDGLVDSLTVYQINKALILTEHESDCMTIEDKVINKMPVWLWSLIGYNETLN